MFDIVALGDRNFKVIASYRAVWTQLYYFSPSRTNTNTNLSKSLNHEWNAYHFHNRRPRHFIACTFRCDMECGGILYCILDNKIAYYWNWTSASTLNNVVSTSITEKLCMHNLLSNVPAADSHSNYFGISLSYWINLILTGCETLCVA